MQAEIRLDDKLLIDLQGPYLRESENSLNFTVPITINVCQHRHA